MLITWSPRFRANTHREPLSRGWVTWSLQGGGTTFWESRDHTFQKLPQFKNIFSFRYVSVIYIHLRSCHSSNIFSFSFYMSYIYVRWPFQKLPQFKCIPGYIYICYNAVMLHDIVHIVWIKAHLASYRIKWQAMANLCLPVIFYLLSSQKVMINLVISNILRGTST